jgi:hypothetical protein
LPSIGVSLLEEVGDVVAQPDRTALQADPETPIPGHLQPRQAGLDHLAVVSREQHAGLEADLAVELRQDAIELAGADDLL